MYVCCRERIIDRVGMVRRLSLGIPAITAVTALAALTWFDMTHLSMRECVDQEEKDYPHLEQVAQHVMGSVGDRVRRGSLCEDAVEPGAYVHVSVYDWSTRKAARDYLRETGIVVPVSQGIRIHYATTVDLENGGRRYVTVSFSMPR